MTIFNFQVQLFPVLIVLALIAGIIYANYHIKDDIDTTPCEGYSERDARINKIMSETDN
jgi:prolipoprotein diacylglyceryltransferase